MLSLAGWKPSVCSVRSVLVFPQPFLKWRGRVGGKRMKYWLAPLKAEAHSTLCRRRKQKRGEKESTLEWESEVTEFIRSVGSEPSTCLWVSVAVPVHVFSLSSGRPHSPQSLCQSSLIVLALSSWFRFFVLCRSCDCPQTCFRPSQGNLSGLESHQREASKEDGLTRPLFVLLASFSALCCAYLHAMSISWVFLI